MGSSSLRMSELNDALSLQLSEEQKEKLLGYVELLKQWNQVYNLTRITNNEAIVRDHLQDSLVVVPYLDGTSYLDVGSGAGIPGLILAIACPERDFTLLDCNQKKTRFMQQAVYELNLPHVTVVTARIEDWQPPSLFDGVIFRAFTALERAVVLTRHCLRPEGRFLAMMGQLPDTISPLPDDIQVLARTRLPIVGKARHLVSLGFSTRGTPVSHEDLSHS